MAKKFLILLVTIFITLIGCATQDFEDTRDIHNDVYDHGLGDLTIRGSLKTDTGMLLKESLVTLDLVGNGGFQKYVVTDSSGNFVFTGLSRTIETLYVLHLPYENQRASIYENQGYEFSKSDLSKLTTDEIRVEFGLKKATTSKIYGTINVFDGKTTRAIQQTDGILVLKLLNVDKNYFTGILKSDYSTSSYEFNKIATGNYKVISYINGFKYESNVLTIENNKNKELNILFDIQY